MSRRYLLLAARFVIFLTGCLVAAVASAQAPAPQAPQPKPVELVEADSKADAETFVVGDWYKLRVKRRGVSAQLEGTLVKVNEQWIVLRRIREGRNDFAVPVVSKLPIVGKMFSNVGIGRADDMLWIPREAAKVEQRTLSVKQTAATEEAVAASTSDLAEKKVVLTAAQAEPDAQPSVGEEPPAGRACELEIAGAKEPEQATGDVIAVTDAVVSLMVTRNVAVSEQVPLVGELPIIGRAFTRERIERRKERRQIDRADILCVRVSNHQPVVASVELVPAPSEPTAPVAPSPPMPK